MGVNGKYKCVCTTRTDDGLGQVLSHYGDMVLYEQDGDLKGEMFATFFWLHSPFRNGKVDGNKFSFTVYFATPCQQYAMQVEGEVNGDTVTGTATNPMGTCELTGTRVADVQVL